MSLLSPSLEAFMAIVETSTVLSAAQKLGLTQTGVTQRIRVLEKQLGVTLFLRSRKGMRTTPEGEALRRYCEASRQLEGRAMAELTGRTDAPLEIRISGPSSVLRSRLIPRFTSVARLHPRLRFHFQLTDIGGVLEKLKRGETDLGVLAPKDVVLELDSRVMKPERYVLVGPKAWKKRAIAEILENESIIDFDPNDPVTFSFLEKYRWLAKARKERHFANNTDALASMVAMGLGYSVLTEEFARPFLMRGELIDLTPGKHLDQPLALAWYPRPEMPAYLLDLLQSLR